MKSSDDENYIALNDIVVHYFEVKKHSITFHSI